MTSLLISHKFMHPEKGIVANTFSISRKDGEYWTSLNGQDGTKDTPDSLMSFLCTFGCDKVDMTVLEENGKTKVGLKGIDLYNPFQGDFDRNRIGQQLLRRMMEEVR